MMKKSLTGFALMLLVLCNSNIAFAHCDTMDGPVIADAKKAIELNNVNYVLKWVQPGNEEEIKGAFDLAMKVRVLSPEAKELSDRYFFETLVRIHRNGEGVPYEGIKPSGTPVDEKILAADKSIEAGNLTPLNSLVDQDKMPELKQRFDKVMLLRNFDVNDVRSGREYIEAYVQFFHFAEGGEEGHHHGAIAEGGEEGHMHGAIAEDGHLTHLPWISSGLLLLTTLLFATLYIRKK